MTTIYSHIFLYFLSALLYTNVQLYGGRLHFTTFMCNINYKSIYYASLPISYYSQLSVMFTLTIVLQVTLHNCELLREFILHLCLLVD